MANPYGVKSIHLEATGTALTGRFYLQGYQVLSGGTAGDVIVRDGGSSGAIGLEFNIPNNTNNALSTNIPNGGILFETDMHVTLPTAAKITLFYQAA